MMNIRDYFLINKTKSSNKIKILDLLGFESDTLIENSSYELPTHKQSIYVYLDLLLQLVV